MSIEALLEATRDSIISALDLRLEYCDIQPEGRPPAQMGQFYIALDEGQIACVDRGMLNEEYTVFIYLTLRTGEFPRDRLADVYDRDSSLYMAGRRSLTFLERKIIKAIHGSETLRILANNKLGIATRALTLFDVEGENPDFVHRADEKGGDGTEFGQEFQQPIWYRGRGTTQFKGAEWIGGEVEETFAVRQLTFTGGRRTQTLALMQ